MRNVAFKKLGFCNILCQLVFILFMVLLLVNYNNLESHRISH